MTPETESFLQACTELVDIDPALSKDAFRGYIALVRAASNEAGALRAQFVDVQGDEDDRDIRGIVNELDQKLGALEREAGAMLNQAAKVQSIMREIREAAPRIKADAERVRDTKVAAAELVALPAQP